MVLLHQTSNLNQWKSITVMKDINYVLIMYVIFYIYNKIPNIVQN